jgi:hypothetical protein
MPTYQLVVDEVALPQLPDGDHTLLSLEEASFLPILGGNFEPRQLLREANAGRLKSTRPTMKQYYTTRAWVSEWIERSCHAHENPRDFGSTRRPASGASSTPERNAALASARATARRLKGF